MKQNLSSVADYFFPMDAIVQNLNVSKPKPKVNVAALLNRTARSASVGAAANQKLEEMKQKQQQQQQAAAKKEQTTDLFITGIAALLGGVGGYFGAKLKDKKYAWWGAGAGAIVVGGATYAITSKK